MCGIVGIINHSKAGAVIDAMIRAVHHRGPDDHGRYVDPNAGLALGQTRLSILDLSVAGHQPMSYADGRFLIVYNGEIYNYRELRIELEKAGHQFQSHTDTEVILAAYAQWGTDAIRRFRGMFAFALYDRMPRTGGPSVVLVRDRMGIKPLLYAAKDGWLAFASEIRALLASGLIDRNVDPDAVLDYLAAGSVSQPRTILADVKALPPGCWLEVRGERHQLVRYWDLHSATTALRHDLLNISFESAVEEVRCLLLDAARCSMIADVPVGAFLSGGIDSTAVVGLMGEASGQQIRTFSVGFEDAHQEMDERQYARQAAQHLGSNHSEVVVSATEAADIFPQIVAAIDQPSLDGTNTWLVSRAARLDVKVAISGLGGDEMFAGYPHFREIENAVQNCPAGFPLGLQAMQALHALRPNRFTLSRIFRYASPVRRLAMLRRLMGDAALKGNVLPRWCQESERRLDLHQRCYLLKDADGVQQTSYAELNGYLLSTLLRDGDVMSMAHGLEVRPLLLDHPLVEFVYALPSGLKLRSGVNKELLVAAAQKYLPLALCQRPKMGFEMPFSGWMAGPLKDQMQALLRGETAKAVFQVGYLSRLRASVAAGNPPRELWAWAILLAWCERYGVQCEKGE